MFLYITCFTKGVLKVVNSGVNMFLVSDEYTNWSTRIVVLVNEGTQYQRNNGWKTLTAYRKISETERDRDWESDREREREEADYRSACIVRTVRTCMAIISCTVSFRVAGTFMLKG